MPESESAAKSEKVARADGGPSFIRTAMLYLVVAAIAAAISGLYFFSYVPAKLQYFLGMRFRTLAVAAGQFKSKAESLSAGLTSAKNSIADPEAYLSILVPELKGTSGFELDDHHIAWSDLVAQASSATQANFDDLFLADELGHVVWQRERTTPRIGSLTPLFDSKTVAESWSLFSLQWSIQTTQFPVERKDRVVPDTAASTLVNLDGRPSVLLTQPVTVQIDGPGGGKVSRGFLLGGFISRGALQNEAMHVPTEWVVYALVPFALVFLSLPFIKLATVTPKERYSFGDMAFLVVCTILVAAIGGALPFLSDSASGDSDSKLKSLADAIDQNMGTEAGKFLALTRTILDGKVGALKPCFRAVGGLDESSCDFWQAVATDPTAGFADLDVISWVGTDGFQVWKWTAKSQITPLVSQNYPHFVDILAKRTWSLKKEPKRGRFTIEPLRSPTTSDMAFVFAVDNDVVDTPPSRQPWVPSAWWAPMMALNVKPQSLVNPLVPPGFGFAVLAADGRVLFHSTSALSLEENFLHELSDVGPIASAMSAGGEAWWTGDYHGRRHRLYSAPVGAYNDCPWRLVTFREIEPLLDFSAGRQSSALMMFIGYALVLLVLVAGYLLHHRLAGRRVKDVVIATLIQTRDPKITAGSMLILGRLALFQFLGIVLTQIVNPRYFTFLFLVFFVGAPVFGVVAVARARHHARPGKMPAYQPDEYAREAIVVFLIALVLGALPAAGMVRMAHRLDQVRQNLVWLKASQKRAVERDQSIRGLVNRTESYTPDTKALLLTKGFAVSHIEAAEPERFSYQSTLLGIGLDKTRKDATAFGSYESPWIETRIEWLRGLFSSSTVVAPGVDISDDERSIRLQNPEGENGPRYAADLQAGSLVDVRFWPTIAGLTILTAVFFLIHWARHALSSHGTADAMSIEDTIRQVQEGGPNSAILIIGPARNEKDRIAAEAIKAVTGREAEHRIRLLDINIKPDWVDAQIAAADRLKDREHGPEWLWIHVSNLETQLVDPKSRLEVFRLLEKLAERKVRLGVMERPTGLIVTTTVDPTAHFSEVFREERKEIYANSIPEVELNRSSLLLSRFRRCYVTIDGRNPWSSWYHYDPARWPDTLKAETSNHRLLSAVRVDLLRAWKLHPQVAMDDLRRAIRVRAEACYQLLWTSCTRSEKLVLIQLAQEGLINPKSSTTVDELIAKGLVWPGAAPAIMNMTFRDFLRDIERADVVQQWEHMDGSGLWVVSGRLVASVLMVGGLFYLLTQGISIQSVLPIISGSGFLGFPLLRSVAGFFSPKKDGAALS